MNKEKSVIQITVREQILEKLGNRCRCGETNTEVLQLDHKLGQGYLEKQFFKSRQEMFEQYLKEFEYESKYLQILCFNCNVKKRNRLQETKKRPGINDIKVLNKPFDEANPAEVIELLWNYPQFRPLVRRQVRMIQRIYKEVQENKE